MESLTDEAEISWYQHWGPCKRTLEVLNEDGVCNIGTHNVNSFPDQNEPKLVRMHQTYKDMHVVGMSELNRNWSRMSEKDQLRNKFKKLWRNKRIKTTWLREKNWKFSKVQQGGVALMARGEAATYTQDVSEDSHGLGRWNWMCLEASSVNEKTAIFQIYRPKKNIEDAGSSYMQQKAMMKTNECPLVRFSQDLLKQIDDIILEGFQIILMGDFNIDLTSKDPLIEELKNRGIVDIMEQKHEYKGVPNTRSPGSKPIDGIFSSKSLEVIRCGYDAGDPMMSDHRFVWAQFSWRSMLGDTRAKVCSHKERCLQTKYKKVTKKFNELLEEQIEIHKLLDKAIKLYEGTEDGVPLTDEQST